MKYLGLVAALAAAPAHAGQPIHESLVECSVLLDLMIGSETPADGNETLMLFAKGAEAMRVEATNRTDASYVTRTSSQKNTLWHQRWDDKGWDNPANRGELGEWFEYCFGLADHLGLELPG